MPAVLDEFWRKGMERNKNYESTVTLGMRGDGDTPMSASDEHSTAGKDRRRPAPDPERTVNPDMAKEPQVWALYKEVQDYYEKGMRVPDDVTLLWSDDNWGNLRRLPTAGGAQAIGRRRNLLSLRLCRRPAQLQVAEYQFHPQDMGADESGAELWRGPDLGRQCRRPQANGVSDRVLSEHGAQSKTMG